MIVKMIQNSENKMELQINSLETRIEKMQEMFNKNLEGKKKSQSVMNNAIIEIISTLEGTNSRITEAEDRLSEVEGRIMEINEAERKKKKELKEMSFNCLTDLWDNVECCNIQNIGVPEEEDKKMPRPGSPVPSMPERREGLRACYWEGPSVPSPAPGSPRLLVAAAMVHGLSACSPKRGWRL